MVKFQLKKKGKNPNVSEEVEPEEHCDTAPISPSLHPEQSTQAHRAQVRFLRHTSPAPGSQGNF